MSQKDYYLTTPLYYVNAQPHIGHSYTTIAADVLSRFKRLMGKDVFFLTGTDEHGQKVQKASEAQGLTPEEFTDRLSGMFRDLWQTLDVRCDDFIRTTEPRHVQSVQAVWKSLESKGLIYLQTYRGWYCTPCESFWPEKDISGSEGGAKRCPECERELEALEEENYFFAISKYQEWLIRHIEEHPDFIRPETRRNETLSFLKNQSLNDLCISRPKKRLSWGIECPLSKDHVTYVWFDALINYISACGYPDCGAAFSKRWPCDVHLIGKDILRPHTVYWPIMLKALDLEPPRMVFAHGWWMHDKAKMSKTLGNVIQPDNVVREFGVDPYRYFLMREIPFGQDGTYSEESITLRYNNDLANDLGNLLHRTLTMVEKYLDGAVPAKGAEKVENGLRTSAKGLALRMEKSMDRMDFQGSLAQVWQLIDGANKFIENLAPWRLFKEGKTQELLEGMVSLCETLRIVAQGVSPFMPQTAGKIWKRLGLEDGELCRESFRNTDWNYFQKTTRVQKRGSALSAAKMIDPHCHLYFEQFEPDLKDVIERAGQCGIRHFINVGIDVETNRRAVCQAQSHPGIFASVGFHPHAAESFPEESVRFAGDLVRSEKKVVAVGEIGLDYKKSRSDAATQMKVFGQMGRLGAETRLPLIVHSREAFGDTLEVLGLLKKENPGLEAVLHCFSYGVEEMKAFTDLGFYISFSGNVTYPKSGGLRETLREAPPERWMIETDAPFLSPQGSRGQRNEPSRLSEIAVTAGAVRGLDAVQAMKESSANALRLFRIPPERKA